MKRTVRCWLSVSRSWAAAIAEDQELSKKQAEAAKVSCRNIRRDGNDAIKKATKDKKIAEDDEKRAMDEIQKLTDDEIKKMEEMSKAKEKEVMEI